MKEQNERRNKWKYRNGQRKGNNPNREGNYNNRKGNIAMAAINNDMILIANNVTQKINKHKWIADSGATTHITDSLEGMFEMTDQEMTISVGDGRKLKANNIGNLWGKAFDLEEQMKKVTPTHVSYVSRLMVSLFSIIASMATGLYVLGSKKGINLTNNQWRCSFITRLEHPKATFLQPKCWQKM